MRGNPPANPVTKGDVVALAVTHSATYAFSSGRGTERKVTYTLAMVASATRKGEAKTLQRAGGATLRGEGKYAQFRLSDVMTIATRQSEARRLFATFKGEWLMGAAGPDDEFNSIDALKAAIVAA